MNTIFTPALRIRVALMLGLALLPCAAQDSLTDEAPVDVESVRATPAARPSTAPVDSAVKPPSQDAGIPSEPAIAPAPPTDSRSTIRQGLRITTGDPNTEIIINGRSYGCHERVAVRLPVGEYTITARKGGCYDDVEQESVEPDEISYVDLHVRRIKVEVHPPTFIGIVQEGNATAAMGLSAGVQYQHTSVCAFFVQSVGSSGSSSTMVNDSTSRDYSGDRFLMGGVQVQRLFYAGRFLQTGMGVALGVGNQSRYYEQYHVDSVSTYYYEVGWTTSARETYDRSGDENNTFIIAGPRVTIAGGIERVKAQVGGAYMIRSDTGMLIDDQRNFFVLEAGVCLVF